MRRFDDDHRGEQRSIGHWSHNLYDFHWRQSQHRGIHQLQRKPFHRLGEPKRIGKF